MAATDIEIVPAAKVPSSVVLKKVDPALHLVPAGIVTLILLGVFLLNVKYPVAKSPNRRNINLEDTICSKFVPVA
jgi:hypothetical protein